jgi:CheY-like chemotaxis protein
MIDVPLPSVRFCGPLLGLPRFDVPVRAVRGWSVRESAGDASNGGDAVDKAIEMRPDAMFMDIRMPGLGGFESPDNKKNLRFRAALEQITY